MKQINAQTGYPREVLRRVEQVVADADGPVQALSKNKKNPSVKRISLVQFTDIDDDGDGGSWLGGAKNSTTQAGSNDQPFDWIASLTSNTGGSSQDDQVSLIDDQDIPAFPDEFIDQ